MPQGNFEAMRLVGILAISIFLIFFGLIIGASIRRQRLNKKLKGPLEESKSLNNPIVAKPLVQAPTQEPAAGEALSVTPSSIAEENLKSLDDALLTTKKSFWGRIQSVFSGSVDKNLLEEIEEVLYTSDIGSASVQRFLNSIEDKLSRSEKKDADIVKLALREEMASIFSKTQKPFEGQKILDRFQFQNPTIWLIIGVNGAGKTTTIGKLSALLAQEGKKVLVAAGDTFRAAAGSQLKVWTERAAQHAQENLKGTTEGLVEIFYPEGISDPSAVAYDAVAKGKARGFDVVIVDTAGRLHTQQNLMEELKKLKRVVQKVLPEAPHETLLVLDSNQGQNALVQAKEFNKALGLTGVILTKMDGTAKGGVAIGVAAELEVPIKMIGVGEKLHDLRPFETQEFLNAIL